MARPSLVFTKGSILRKLSASERPAPRLRLWRARLMSVKTIWLVERTRLVRLPETVRLVPSQVSLVKVTVRVSLVVTKALVFGETTDAHESCCGVLPSE